MSAGALSDGSAVVERLSGAEAGSIGFALRGRRLLCFTAVALRKSLRVKHGEMLASHCVKCCEMLNLGLAFFSYPRNGSVRGKVSLVLNLYGLKTKAALPRTENLRGDEKEQKHRLNLGLAF